MGEVTNECDMMEMSVTWEGEYVFAFVEDVRKRNGARLEVFI